MVETRTGKIVVRANLPTPMANGAAFGAGTGRVMQQMGGMGQNVSMKSLDVADKQAQKEAVNRGMEWESDYEKLRRETVNGDILARKGKQALGSTAQWEKTADEWYQEKLKETGNDYEKEVLKNMYMRRNSSTLDTLSRFEAGEKERYYDENTASRIKNSLDDALANYTDPHLVEQAYNSGIAAINVNYAGRGEILDDKLKDYRNSFYKTQTLRRADENANEAIEYYGKHKASILGGDQTAVEKILKDKKQYQEELPYKLLQRQVKVAEFQTQIKQFQSQIDFDEKTKTLDDSQKLKYLQDNENAYSTNWFKSKQKALLSVKGITAETRAETAEELLLDITELSNFNEEDYIRGANNLLAKIEDKYAEGEVSLAIKTRLVNNVNKKREDKLLSLSDQDEWFSFSYKDAQKKINDRAAIKLYSSKIMLDYFQKIDGKDLDDSQKKAELDRIMKVYNDKVLTAKALGESLEAKPMANTQAKTINNKYKIEVID